MRRATCSSKGWPTHAGASIAGSRLAQYARTNARGFVLPERGDTPGRFVVCWDGLIYPALSVGEPADLDRDIQDLAASLKQKRGGQVIE